MSVSQLTHVQDADFDQVVLSDPSPVLVEFYSPWCEHCRRMAPIVGGLAQEYARRLRFVQADAETNTAALMRYGVEGVPTMIVLAGGKEIGRMVGEMPRKDLEAEVIRVLARAPQSSPP